MNDLYEYKANKYKLKYLKLKRKYIAEGGDISNIINKEDFKKLNITDEYKVPTYNEDLTGIFLNNDSFHKILVIQNHDPKNYNTPKIEYIGGIEYNYEFFNTKYNIITKYFGKGKKLNLKRNSKYYYIICETLSKEYNFDGIHFKEILNSLKTSIDNLIKNLYNNNYILDNINESNMTIKSNKVYFFNYNNLRIIKDENEKNNDIKALVKFIRWLFESIFESVGTHKDIKIDYLPIYYGTLELLEQLYEDDKNNKIYDPDTLSRKLEVIINSIIEPNEKIDIDFIKQKHEFFITRFITKLDKIIINNDNDNDIVKYINGINKLYDTMYRTQYYKKIYDFNFEKIIEIFKNIIKNKSNVLNIEKINYINTLLDKTDYMIKLSIDKFINIITNKIEIIYKTDININQDIYQEIDEYINTNNINKIDKNNEKYIKLFNFISICPSHKLAVLDLFNHIKEKLEKI
jgi:hypothetical protein